MNEKNADYIHANRYPVAASLNPLNLVQQRLQDDRPSPGQQVATRGILVAREAYKRGADISINWVPGNAGVPGNEMADQWAALQDPQ